MAQYLRVKYNNNNYDIPTKTTYENDLAKKLDIGKTLTNENLNNITTDGLYRAGGSNSVTNKPSGVDAFGLKVYHIALGYIIQELTVGTAATGIKYQRWYSTSWSSWIPQPTLNTIPTTNQVVIFDGIQGRLKSSGYTIATSVPSGAVFTDTKVTQNASITTNDTYPILLGYSNDTTALTNTVNKTSSLKYNPSSLLLNIGDIYLDGGSIYGLRYQSYNLIKFDGNGNCLVGDTVFNTTALQASVGATVLGAGSAGPSFHPTGTIDLGNTINSWNNLYLGNTIYSNGIKVVDFSGGIISLYNIDRSNLCVKVNASSLSPSASTPTDGKGGLTLGTQYNYWNNIYVNEVTNPNTGDFYVNAGTSTNTNTSHLYLVASANKKYNGIGSSSINFKVTSFTGVNGFDWLFKYQYHTYYNRPCFYCPDSTSSSTQGMIGNTFNPFYEVNAQYLRGTTSSSSDRNMKHNIKYLDNQNNTTSLLSNTNTTIENNDITTEDVINFVESLNICTFEYNFDNVDEGSKQLGIIADDIENTKLFPYVGEHNSDYKEENKGKISRLYLQHLPLTTVALTACKYLLNEVKQLKEQIEKQTA